MMPLHLTTRRHLLRLEEARRQTVRQLDLIDRQIARRLALRAAFPHVRMTQFRRGRSAAHRSSRGHYRSCLMALTAEHQPEVDALMGRLSSQEAAIATILEQTSGQYQPHGRSGDGHDR